MKTISGKNNPFYGKKHSWKSRKKMRMAHLGIKLSEATKRKIGIASKNTPRTEEWKKRISESLVGRSLSEETKKKISTYFKKHPVSYWLGKKRPPETVEKMRKAMVGKSGKLSPAWRGGFPDCKNCGKKLSMRNGKLCNSCASAERVGEKHWNWQGGITPINNKIRGSIEYKLWQDSVFARDGYTCQKCHQTLKPYKLVGHHVLNFSNHIELRFAIDNGCTLCKKDHKEFHKIYGKKNNTKEQLEEFLSIK